jgi:hypothetical protein
MTKKGFPESAKILKRLDSRFHRGNDGIAHFQTFYKTIVYLTFCEIINHDFNLSLGLPPASVQG